MSRSDAGRLFIPAVIVLALLQAGTKVYNRYLETKLPDAVCSGNLAQVRYLLAHGADPNRREEYGPVLHLAIHSGQPDVAIALLQAGADPNTMQKTETTLHCAIASGTAARMRPVVAALLDKGVNPNQPSFTDPKHYCALYDAARSSTPEIVELLLAKGAVSNADGTNDLNRLLDQAASGNNVNTARFLLRHGANARSAGGGLALCAAADLGNIEMLTLLLDAGADVDFTAWDGNTVLAFSVMQEKLNVVHLLLSRGADVHKYTGTSHSALYYAERSHNPQIKELISKAASRKHLALQ